MSYLCVQEEGSSMWWNNLININRCWRGCGKMDLCELGDGALFLFWWDPWLEGEVLKDRFIHLFELYENKMTTLTET
jgi:hypothetical protein